MNLTILNNELLGYVDLIRRYKDNPSPLWKYTITHSIRWIHDKESFPTTDIVRKKLNVTSLNKNERKKFNKALVEDSLMIEHLITVKTLVKGLFKLNLTIDDDKAIKIVRDFLEENTQCIIKFKILEKDLVGKDLS